VRGLLSGAVRGGELFGPARAVREKELESEHQAVLDKAEPQKGSSCVAFGHRHKGYRDSECQRNTANC